MEITYFIKTATYYTHDVTIVINGKILEYTIHSAFLSNGKKYIQSYGKKQFNIKLTTSERKKVKQYIEIDFLETIK